MSWAPLDLTAAIDGPTQPEPSILPRTDGKALLYPGRLHGLAAEPGAGKSWFACAAAAELIGTGRPVVYCDFESKPEEIVGRIRALGIPDDQILGRLLYVRPDEPLTKHKGAIAELLAHKPALFIFDGVTEAMTLHGLNLEDNNDVAKWLALAPSPATCDGAASLVLDHVPKKREGRGRGPIGAQHKLAGVDVELHLEIEQTFGRDQEGVIKVSVMKDRPGWIESLARRPSREVAVMRLLSAAESVAIEFEPPGTAPRETAIKEQIIAAINEAPGLTTREIREVGGKAQVVDSALSELVAAGNVELRPEGNAHRHYVGKPLEEVSG